MSSTRGKKGGSIQEASSGTLRRRSRARASVNKTAKAGATAKRAKSTQTRSARRVQSETIPAADPVLSEPLPETNAQRPRQEFVVLPEATTELLAAEHHIYPDVFYEEAGNEEPTVVTLSSEAVSAGNSGDAGVLEALEHETPACEEAPESEAMSASQSLIESHSLNSRWNRSLSLLTSKLSGLFAHIRVSRSQKRLRVCESVSLGEKRFLALIQVDGEEFLVGGASNSISTLARLERSQKFSDVLSQQWAEDPARA